ncbi:MAG: pseudoazurin [Halioglobus sp.]|nr:pseudoazurin [Halioglobus sp.]
MKKTISTLLIIGISLFPGLAWTANYEVKMLNSGAEGFMVFEPAVLSVEVGDAVTFVATDMAHNSASMPGMIPDGATAWNGELNQNITVTFNTPGVYAYQCTPHAMMAMVGVINVGQSAENLAAVKAAAEEKKSSFITNQDRLDNYLAQLQ